MLNTTMTLVLTLSMGQYPVSNGNAIEGAFQNGPSQGMVASGMPAYGDGESPGGHYSAGLTGSMEEELYPYDGPEPWIHGYWQEIPAYGGFGAYRPYNYKHALAQSQASGGWGMSPKMPYSQQYWHRYQQRAQMLKQAQHRAPVYNNYRHPVASSVQWQQQSRIQPVSARSYAPVRRPVQQRSVKRPDKKSGLSQRLAETDKRKAAKQPKKSFLPNIFSQQK